MSTKKARSHGMPEAGRLATSIQLRGNSENLRRSLKKHDLGSGVADCGCVVMDYRFYPCQKHSGE